MHLAIVLMFWVCILLIYWFQLKLDSWLNAFCAMCRGDDEYDYDSEDDSKEELEVEEESVECQNC